MVDETPTFGSLPAECLRCIVDHATIPVLEVSLPMDAASDPANVCALAQTNRVFMQQCAKLTNAADVSQLRVRIRLLEQDRWPRMSTNLSTNVQNALRELGRQVAQRWPALTVLEMEMDRNVVPAMFSFLDLVPVLEGLSALRLTSLRSNVPVLSVRLLASSLTPWSGACMACRS